MNTNEKVTEVTSYRSIIRLALPIMLGSAVQNVIALSDSVFLYHLSEFDFQVIGIVSVFYLIISAIGFGFSRGGQILIARRHGEGNPEGIRKSLYALLAFELFLAVGMFLFIQLFGYNILAIFINNNDIIVRGMEYLIPRSYGIFFSYIGVGLIAYYTGVSKPKFIVIDTLILAAVNIVMNYGLIFGNFGLPVLEIAGAGWASAIAEAVAFIIFVIYMLVERNPVVPNIFKLPKIDFSMFSSIYRISINIVLQTIVGLGSWFVFFGLIENLGGRALSQSNLVRIIYLCLSIPTWGFASAMNTITSRLIGRGLLSDVVSATNKVTLLNFGLTMLITIPVIFFPETVLYPLFGKEDMSLFEDSRPLFYLLLIILVFFSIGSIYFDSIIGMGATRWGFIVKLVISGLYLLVVKFIVDQTSYGLLTSWGVEIAYWMIILLLSAFMFYSGRWKKMIVE